jgi:hypothetical protein
MEKKYKQKVCKECGKSFTPRSPVTKFCDVCKVRVCLHCQKEFPFIQDKDRKHSGKFCSPKCYFQHRWGGVKKCKNCSSDVKIGLRYCSPKCRNEYWDRNEYQLIKKKRLWERKIEIIKKLGGKCVECGNTDIWVLDINHLDRGKKRRPSNGKYTWQFRLKEWNENLSNLKLLCANCHRIHTWEQMNYGDEKVQKRNINYRRNIAR